MVRSVHSSSEPAESESSCQSRRTYLVARILFEHLEAAARRDLNDTILDGLTYASAIPLLDASDEPPALSPNSDDADILVKDNSHGHRRGGLSTTDLQRFVSSATSTQRYEARLMVEMKRTLLSVADFYVAKEDVTSENERLKAALQLPDRIRVQKEGIVEQRSILREQQTRILQLVKEIDEIHPRLEEQLTTAIMTLPPMLNTARAAEADVLALTIESSLLKLSLLRARAHIALYGHTSPSRPQATMTRALAAAQEKLRMREHAQDKEERELDAQIAAYEAMLSLVGGPEGGFGQVVEDMARVRKETEECKRDLRRLGWTGD